MIDMFVISGANKWPCQKCGKTLLPIYNCIATCTCGQIWDISPCMGDGFARMALERTGFSRQSGDSGYFNGYLVKAILEADNG
uniref:Uncharacterized protein n=1 Tax=viral metagenome TaxID=1070528 RepID=A0A6M3LSA8_9ZZZZ